MLKHTQHILYSNGTNTLPLAPGVKSERIEFTCKYDMNKCIILECMCTYMW